MANWLGRLATAVQLTRLTTAFGAVSDLWFIVLLTRALPGYEGLPAATLDLPGALLAAALVAIGVFAYGAALNDVLDVRHDSAFSPERPIPAGRIKAGQAVVMSIGSLIVAALASNALGTWALWITLMIASGVLFFNAAGKHIPAVGLITLAFVHAAHMFIPNHQLAFLLPVWLVMTHALVIQAVVHVLEDKRPRLSRRAVVFVCLAWTAASAFLFGLDLWHDGRLWPQHVPPVGLLAPVLAVAGFVAVARRKTEGIDGRSAAEKLRRYGAMWQALYGAAWLVGLEQYEAGLWLGLFAVFGFIMMTGIKHAIGLARVPIAYRG